jgi:hypothetical protein
MRTNLNVSNTCDLLMSGTAYARTIKTTTTKG